MDSPLEFVLAFDTGNTNYHQKLATGCTSNWLLVRSSLPRCRTVPLLEFGCIGRVIPERVRIGLEDNGERAATYPVDGVTL